MSPRHADDASGDRRRTGPQARLPRWLAGLLCIVLTTLSLGVVHPAVRADDATLDVTFTSMSPSAVTDEGDLTLTGTITNKGSATVNRPTVHMWRNRAPLTNADALNFLVKNQSSEPMGDVVTTSAAAQTVASLTPGASANFTVRAAFSGGGDPLALVSPGNAYLVGVRVDNSAGTQVGSSRTLISYPGTSKYDATTVAELASAPSYVGTDNGKPVFTDDHLAAEISPDGRLGQLVQLAEADNVSSVIDPLLVDELTAMASGYEVRSTDGTRVPGRGQDAASSFLRRIQGVAANGRSYRGLYGMLGVSAAASASRHDLLVSAAQQSAGNQTLKALPLAITATGNALTSNDLEYLASAKPTLVLAQGIDPASPVRQATVRQGAPTQLTVVSVQTTLGDGGPAPAPDQDLVHRVGRLQSEQLVRAAAYGTSVHLVTGGDAARAELAAATGRVRVPLQELLKKQTSRVALQTGNTDEISAPGSLTGAESTAQTQLGFYKALTGEDAGIDTELLITRVWSGSFADADAAEAYLNTAMATVSAALQSGGVEVHMSEKLVVPSKSTSLPISLTNSMSIPVRVRVHFDSDNSSRIDIDDTDVIRLDPGESATVRITPHASGSGTVQMDAMVMTAGDQAHQLGDSVRFTVQANNVGNIGWIIIIASGVVLLGATALRVRQVRHERAQQHTPADDDPDVPFDPRPLDD